MSLRRFSGQLRALTGHATPDAAVTCLARGMLLLLRLEDARVFQFKDLHQVLIRHGVTIQQMEALDVSALITPDMLLHKDALVMARTLSSVLQLVNFDAVDHVYGVLLKAADESLIAKPGNARDTQGLGLVERARLYDTARVHDANSSMGMLEDQVYNQVLRKQLPSLAQILHNLNEVVQEHTLESGKGYIARVRSNTGLRTGWYAPDFDRTAPGVEACANTIQSFLEQKHNVILYAASGSGKTSTVFQMARTSWTIFLDCGKQMQAGMMDIVQAITSATAPPKDTMVHELLWAVLLARLYLYIHCTCANVFTPVQFMRAQAYLPRVTDELVPTLRRMGGPVLLKCLQHTIATLQREGHSVPHVVLDEAQILLQSQRVHGRGGIRSVLTPVCEAIVRAGFMVIVCGTNTRLQDLLTANSVLMCGSGTHPKVVNQLPFLGPELPGDPDDLSTRPVTYRRGGVHTLLDAMVNVHQLQDSTIRRVCQTCSGRGRFSARILNEVLNAQLEHADVDMDAAFQRAVAVFEKRHTSLQTSENPHEQALLNRSMLYNLWWDALTNKRAHSQAAAHVAFRVLLHGHHVPFHEHDLVECGVAHVVTDVEHSIAEPLVVSALFSVLTQHTKAMQRVMECAVGSVEDGPTYGKALEYVFAHTLTVQSHRDDVNVLDDIPLLHDTNIHHAVRRITRVLVGTHLDLDLVDPDESVLFMPCNAARVDLAWVCNRRVLMMAGVKLRTGGVLGDAFMQNEYVTRPQHVYTTGWTGGAPADGTARYASTWQTACHKSSMVSLVCCAPYKGPLLNNPTTKAWGTQLVVSTQRVRELPNAIRIYIDRVAVRAHTGKGVVLNVKQLKQHLQYLQLRTTRLKLEHMSEMLRQVALECPACGQNSVFNVNNGVGLLCWHVDCGRSGRGPARPLHNIRAAAARDGIQPPNDATFEDLYQYFQQKWRTCRACSKRTKWRRTCYNASCSTVRSKRKR